MKGRGYEGICGEKGILWRDGVMSGEEDFMEGLGYEGIWLVILRMGEKEGICWEKGFQGED